MVNYEKITDLFQQDVFQVEANNCKTMEDFYALFVRNGIEITEEETVELISKIAEEKQKKDNGEISEEDLEDVAGGLVISTTLFCIGVGVACVGAAALSAYVSYNALKWANKKK